MSSSYQLIQEDAANDTGIELRKVTKEEAAFIVGQGGKTKAKLVAVSGAHIELTDSKPPGQGTSQLSIKGSKRQRQCAKKYVEFVVAQRLGPVQIPDPSVHDDLTILTVPGDTVSFITGKGGSFLRFVEEEWCALLFFLQVNPKRPPTRVEPNATERLAIWGQERCRRGAELKVMAAIEMKLPGHFTKHYVPRISDEEGFASDTVPLKDEDYSYALGRNGSTRKKLAKASNCIVEYVGRMAFFSGAKPERTRAKEYLSWLLQQRIQEVPSVSAEGRSDVTKVALPATFPCTSTSFRSLGLRGVEDETSTFIFLEPVNLKAPEEQRGILIFGCLDDRQQAENQVLERLVDKLAQEPGFLSGAPRKGYGKGKDGREGKGKNRERERDNNEEYDDKSSNSLHQATLSGWHTAEKGQGSKEPTTTDVVDITDEDAAFLMGPQGRTKKKIAWVSGARLELNGQRMTLTGGAAECKKARKYIELVMAQRVGPVTVKDPNDHDDLSIVDVPAEAVSFVTGRQGSFLRMVEEEFRTLLFFIDFSRSSRRDQVERLAIFGGLRERRGAELKVMAAIEMKMPGQITKGTFQLPPYEDGSEGFATEMLNIEEDDYSYALGKGGATRKKIARASGCIIEYIGRLAFMSGYKAERSRAREYLKWLFAQRVGSVEVDYANREDVTVLPVPKDCVGFVTGAKGIALRAVEDSTGTFCFIEGGRADPNRDPKPLLIFGPSKARKTAEEKLLQRIDTKLVEGWVDEEGGHGNGYKGYRNSYDHGGYGYGGYDKGYDRGYDKSGYDKGGHGHWKSGNGDAGNWDSSTPPWAAGDKGHRSNHNNKKGDADHWQGGQADRRNEYQGDGKSDFPSLGSRSRPAWAKADARHEAEPEGQASEHWGGAQGERAEAPWGQRSHAPSQAPQALRDEAGARPAASPLAAPSAPPAEVQPQPAAQAPGQAAQASPEVATEGRRAPREKKASRYPDFDDDGSWGDWGGSSSEEEELMAMTSTGSHHGALTPKVSTPALTPKVSTPKPLTSPEPTRSSSGWVPRHSPTAAQSPTSPPYRSGGSSGNLGAACPSPARGAEESGVPIPIHLLHEEAWPDLGMGAPAPQKKGRNKGPTS